MDDERIADLEKRLARIESRLVQLMLFLGADPYGKNNGHTIVRRNYREAEHASAA